MPNDNRVTPGHVAVLTNQILVYKRRRVILSIVTLRIKNVAKMPKLNPRINLGIYSDLGITNPTFLKSGNIVLSYVITVFFRILYHFCIVFHAAVQRTSRRAMSRRTKGLNCSQHTRWPMFVSGVRRIQVPCSSDTCHLRNSPSQRISVMLTTRRLLQ